MNQFKRPLAWLLSLSMVASYIPPSYAQEPQVSGDNQLEIIENQVETQEYPLVIEDTSAQGETTTSDYTYEQFRKEFFAGVENMDKSSYLSDAVETYSLDHELEECNATCSLHGGLEVDYVIDPDYVESGVALQEPGVATFSVQEAGFGFESGQESTRQFRFDSIGSTTKEGTGYLVAQGEHSNIWVIDPKSASDYNGDTASESYFTRFTKYTSGMTLVSSENGFIKGTDANVVTLAQNADTIYKKMTQQTQHAGVVVETPWNNIEQAGDIDKDGRVNMIIYDFSSGFAGYFTGADYYKYGYDQNVYPIDAVHMDVTYMNYEENSGFLGTFAHELQHLMYYTYMNVFNGDIEDSWINESLSGVPDMYYSDVSEGYDPNSSNTSSQNLDISRLKAGTVNDYTNGLTYGDFVNFNQGSKNYGMSYSFSAFMTEMEPEYYGRMYQQFKDNLSGKTFSQAQSYYSALTMEQIYGGAFQNVLKTRMPQVMNLAPELVFEYVYNAFMESFISGGGDVITSNGTAITTQEIMKNPLVTLWSTKNAAGVSAGIGNGYYYSNAYHAEILSGGAVNLVGYPSNSTSINATHEMGYSLSTTNYLADSKNYLKINLTQPTATNVMAYVALYQTNNSYYINSNGTISKNSDPNLNEDHANIYPLVLGQDNYIKVESADMKPFLYVTTYFNDVSSTITYDWVSAPDKKAQDSLVLTDATLYHSLDLADITSGGSGSGAVIYTLIDADGIAKVEDGILTLEEGATEGSFFTVSATKEGDELYNATSTSQSATITVAVDSEAPVITISESYTSGDVILLKLSEVANWNPLTATAHDVVDGYLGQLDAVYTADDDTDLATARTYLSGGADRTVTITFTATDKAENRTTATVTLKSLADSAFIVTTNANGGEFPENATTSVWTEASGTLSEDTLNSLTPPTRQGYTFKGWYEDTTTTNKITTDTEFTEKTVIYAGWDEIVPTEIYFVRDGERIDSLELLVDEVAELTVDAVDDDGNTANNSSDWGWYWSALSSSGHTSTTAATFWTNSLSDGVLTITAKKPTVDIQLYTTLQSTVNSNLMAEIEVSIVSEYTPEPEPELPEIELDFGDDTFKPEEEDSSNSNVLVPEGDVEKLFEALSTTFDTVKKAYGETAAVKYYKHNTNTNATRTAAVTDEWVELVDEAAAKTELETAGNQVKVEYTATVSSEPNTVVATFTLEAKEVEPDTEAPVIYLDGVAVTPDENDEPVDTITVKVNDIDDWEPPVANAVDNVDGTVDVSTIYGIVSGEEVNYENNTLNDLKESLKTVGNRGYISYSAKDSAGNAVEVIVLVISYEGIYVPDGLLKLVFDNEIHESGAVVSYSMSEFDDLIEAIYNLVENIDEVDDDYVSTVSSWVENQFVEEEEIHDWEIEIPHLLLMANSKTKVEFTYNSEDLTYIFVPEDGYYRISVDGQNCTIIAEVYYEEDDDYYETELGLPDNVIRVTVEPDDGYELESLKGEYIKDGESTELELDENNSFTMPEYDVLLTATCIEPYVILNYSDNGRTEDGTIKLNADGTLAETLPTPAEPEGLTFEGWAYEDGVAVDNNSTFASGDTIYVQWAIIIFDVIFMDGDTTASTQSIYHGALVQSHVLDEKDGYDFVGWYETTDFSDTVVKFPVTIKEAKTYYAKWELKSYSVTFDYDNGEDDQKSTVKHGETVTKPETDPTKVGYDFVNWYYLDGETEKEWNFETTITDNVTIYAKWEIITYTVTFQYNNGDDETTSTIDHGTKVTEPTEPTKDGYDFVNWYYMDGATENIWDFDTEVTDDLTIYAKWELKSYTVTFDYDNGENNQESTVKHGETVAKPDPDPTKEGYDFVGWSDDSEVDPDIFEESDAFDFNTTIENDTTLYAVWKIKTFTVTFDHKDEDATVSTVNDIPYNTLIETSDVPIPSNGEFSFLGWWYENEDEDMVQFDPSTETVTGDLTLSAKWSEAYTITVNHPDEVKTIVTGGNGQLGEDMPDVLTSEDTMLVFKGWYTAEEDGEEVSSTYQFTTDSDIYPQWYQLYTITFESSVGGSLSNDESAETFEFITDTDGTIDIGTMVATPEEGYKFLGWFDDESGEAVELTATFEENTKIIAKFYAYYTITLDENHPDDMGTTTTVETDEDGHLSESQLSAPSTSPEGYTFVDWYDAKTEGEVVTSTTLFTGDVTIYAIWKEAEPEDDELDPEDDELDPEVDDEDSEGDDEDTEGDDEDSEGDDEDSEGDDEDSEGDDEDSEGDDEDSEGESGVPEDYTLVGKVIDAAGEPLEGITITVKRNGTTYETVTSNELGNYYLEKTYSGYYYLIFDNGTTTKTVSINFSSDSTNLSTIAMPSHRISTEASISTRTMVQTVAGLDTLADLMSISEKSAVTLSIEILASTPSETQELIENVLGRDNEAAAYFEVAMYKRSYSEGEVTAEEEITEVETLLQLVIDIPTKYQGKENYYIYRLHDNDLDIITTSANTQNERIVLSEDGTTLTVYTRNFSTYAFVYEKDDITSTGPSTGNTYPIIIERLADGEISSSATVGTVGFSNSNPAAGALVTVTPYPGSGYQVEDVTVRTEDGSSLTVVDRGDGSYTFTQGSSIVTVTVSFISTDSIPTLYSLFSDVSVDDYYCDAINQVVEMGLMTGTTSHTFAPDNSLTRGMLVTILYKLSGNNSYGSGQFVDVYTTDYYYNAVAWAKELGIVSGYVDGSFRPGQNVTREELAVIFDSYCEKMNLASYVWLFPSQFMDNNVIGAWASNSVAFCTNLGIMDSKEDYFYPSLHATRGEVAVSLLALSQL